MPSISYNKPNSIVSSQLEPKLRDVRKTITSYSSVQNAPQKQKEVALCRIVMTSNVSLTAFPQVQDGVSLVVFDLVLLTAQTDPKENGVYVNSNPLGTLLRLDILYYDYMIFCVGEGIQGKNTIWQLDSGNIVGTDNLVITKLTEFKAYKKQLGTLFNCYSGVYYNMSNLSHSIGANEVWEYEYNLIFSNNDTGATQDLMYKFTAPVGATTLGSGFYDRHVGGALISDIIITPPDYMDLTSPRIFYSILNNASMPYYLLTIKLVVNNGATAGSIVPQFMSGGALGFLFQTQSWLIANRIA